MFLTHDDIDHVGWNARQDGSPTFPNARYLIHEDALARARATAGKRPHIRLCVLGLDDRIETVRDGHEITPGLTVVALPGHARGHCGLVVGDDAVIVADAVPHPAQVDHPEWTFGYDADPELAVDTRRRILDEFGDREIFLSHAREGVRL